MKKNFLLIFMLFALLFGCDNSSSSSMNGSNMSNSDTVNSSNPNGPYTLFFNSNGGDGYMAPITFQKGENKALSTNIYEKFGFKFIGWSDTTNGVVIYSDKDVISISHDTTLYAVWEDYSSNNTTITFHANNGTTDTNVLNIPGTMYRSSIQLPKNEFSNQGSYFVGWAYSKDAVKADYFDEYPFYYISGNADLYAVWDKNPIVLSFDSNGGSGTMPNIYAKTGDTIYLPSPKFSKEGHIVKGYTIDDDYNIYPVGFGYKVTENNANFKASYVADPNAPEVVFGGNSETYKDTTVWVKGVDVKQEDWVESTLPGVWYGKWRKDAGWYDASQSIYNLCWAGSSSNILHWWHDINKDNVEKYNKHYRTDNNIPNTLYEGFGISNIFRLFANKWPNQGNNPQLALNWYLGASDVINYDGGKFYRDVFYGKVVSERYTSLNQIKFNTALDRAFREGMAISAVEVNALGPHSTTIWGAHFDSNGLVDRIYLTDSASDSSNNMAVRTDTGLEDYDIIYGDDGSVNIKTYLGGSIPLTHIFVVHNGLDVWEEYFKNNEPIK